MLNMRNIGIYWSKLRLRMGLEFAWLSHHFATCIFRTISLGIWLRLTPRDVARLLRLASAHYVSFALC
jgi:hypothetical protein